MIGKVRVTSSGYDPDGPMPHDPTLGDLSKIQPTEANGPYVPCPVCGKTVRDLNDHGGPFDLENDSVEIECGDCEAPLLVSTRVIVTYILSLDTNRT